MLKTVDRLKLQEILHADRIRRRANVMAFGLFGLVIGIYVYTIRKMGQDTFLDDDEPLIKTPPPTQQQQKLMQ